MDALLHRIHFAFTIIYHHLSPQLNGESAADCMLKTIAIRYRMNDTTKPFASGQRYCHNFLSGSLEFGGISAWRSTGLVA